MLFPGRSSLVTWKQSWASLSQPKDNNSMYMFHRYFLISRSQYNWLLFIPTWIPPSYFKINAINEIYHLALPNDSPSSLVSWRMASPFSMFPSLSLGCHSRIWVGHRNPNSANPNRASGAHSTDRMESPWNGMSSLWEYSSHHIPPKFSLALSL